MATSVLVPWLLFAATFAIVLVGAYRLRALIGEVAQRGSRISELDGALESARHDSAKSNAKLRKLGEELELARRKLEKAKKRSEREDERTRGSTPRATTEAEGALEAARQERDAARQRADALAEELAKANERIAAAAANKPLLDNSAISALETRLQEAERSAAKLGSELSEARAKSERARKKHETDQLLYASMRGELAAKKDRLRTQTEELERLRAMKVAIAKESD